MNIARNIRNAVPIKQFNEKVFKQFKLKRYQIPKNNYIYYY